MEALSPKQTPTQINLTKKFIFILFGLASLLGWNAIMSELPFFSFYLQKMDPATSFPFLNYALNIVLQFLMLYNRNLVPLKFRVIGGLISGIIIMIVLPVIVLNLEKNSTLNVIITGALILIMGMINALCSGGFFALVSFFPTNLMIAFSAGQGFSGVMMNIIQYVVLGFVNSENKQNDLNKTAWIYFGISAGILFLVLILLIFELKSDFFKYYLKPLDIRLKEENENENNESDNYKKNEKKITTEIDTQFYLKEDEDKNLIDNHEGEIQKENSILFIDDPTPKKRREISFLEMFKILMDLDLLRTYINFISNTLFPKAGVTQSLFSLNKYKTVTILIIYNLTDFFGRYIVLAFKQTKLKTYIISLGRTVLVFLLIFNYYCEISLKININITSILLIIWVVALGLTDGIGNSLCFGLAPTMVEDELKLQAGSSMSFFTVLGLFLGSCLAFLTKYILEQIDKKK